MGQNMLDDTTTRRRFLSQLGIGLSTLAAAVVGIPIVSYLLSPLIYPSPKLWRNVGTVDQFKIGSTVQVSFEDSSPLAWAGQTARTAAWLRRDDENTFTAFSVNCAHLGCPVSWRPDSGLFLCPCHGGVYYSTGEVAGGPPPHPLDRYPVRVENNTVQIQTTPLPFFPSPGGRV
ncbi:MAG: Rieske (2Fe-2S) protein [Chloroflexi bacterium]|nr:Rieske (2Fe-2S) protein [Chloroflexota bacterium]